MAEVHDLPEVDDLPELHDLPKLHDLPEHHDLKVASYNVHGCLGTDGRFSPDRIVAVLREIGADIVAVQEVDAGMHGGDYLDQWAVLAQSTQLSCIPGISLRTQRKIYGNALLTHLPVRAVRLTDISVPEREPRGAIDVDLEVRGGILRVIATHLGLRAAERRAQSRLLFQALADAPPDRLTLGTLVLGDMNDWCRSAPSLRALTRLCPKAPSPRSFPARFPLFCLDRILGSGGVVLGAVKAHRSRLARLASDHLPVTATLSWAAGKTS